jgi:hypothetical protein
MRALLYLPDTYDGTQCMKFKYILRVASRAKSGLYQHPELVWQDRQDIIDLAGRNMCPQNPRDRADCHRW